MAMMSNTLTRNGVPLIGWRQPSQCMPLFSVTIVGILIPMISMTESYPSRDGVSAGARCHPRSGVRSYPTEMSQHRNRRIRGVVSLGTGVAVIVALGASLLYFLWVASIRNADQIGQLSIGTLVVGVACAFASVMLAFSMIRAIRRAEDGRALLAALLAGGFAIAAALALAASDVLGKLAG